MPDDEFVAQIKAVISELPTYGYRRVHAILKRFNLYFLRTSIALDRYYHKRVAILVLNIFLGWLTYWSSEWTIAIPIGRDRLKRWFRSRIFRRRSVPPGSDLIT